MHDLFVVCSRRSLHIQAAELQLHGGEVGVRAGPRAAVQRHGVPREGQPRLHPQRAARHGLPGLAVAAGGVPAAGVQRPGVPLGGARQARGLRRRLHVAEPGAVPGLPPGRRRPAPRRVPGPGPAQVQPVALGVPGVRRDGVLLLGALRRQGHGQGAERQPAAEHEPCAPRRARRPVGGRRRHHGRGGLLHRALAAERRHLLQRQRADRPPRPPGAQPGGGHRLRLAHEGGVPDGAGPAGLWRRRRPGTDRGHRHLLAGPLRGQHPHHHVPEEGAVQGGGEGTTPPRHGAGRPRLRGGGGGEGQAWRRRKQGGGAGRDEAGGHAARRPPRALHAPRPVRARRPAAVDVVRLRPLLPARPGRYLQRDTAADHQEEGVKLIES
jgi:hypothetical protein